MNLPTREMATDEFLQAQRRRLEDRPRPRRKDGKQWIHHDRPGGRAAMRRLRQAERQATKA